MSTFRFRIALIIPSFFVANFPVFAQSGSADPFEQDLLADGVVSIEAEHFHTNTAVGGLSWVTIPDSSASGKVAMQALPNTGTAINAGYAATSPRLDYRVQFHHTGTHYVAPLGREPSDDNQADTIHAGLDLAEVPTADRISGFSGTYRWRNTTLDGPLASFEVTSTGEHLVSLWMREDGFIVDKFILTTNPDFVPSDLGPPESPRVGGSSSVSDLQQTLLFNPRVSAGVFTADVMPVPAVAMYEAESTATLALPFADDPAAEVDGWALSANAAAPPNRMYRVQALPVDTQTTLALHGLNRLAYGPTPGELERVLTGPSAIGPEAFIEEQLAPESIATESADADPLIVALQGMIDERSARLNELRAWYALRAIRADRQLLEVLTQFFNNHFVTYFNKTRNWFRDQGYTSIEADKIAAHLEHRELMKWREVLMDPNGTFHDLLRISAESPAQIIFLDTVENVKEAPNENYGRELFELYTMGVDNGYEQEDIEEVSKSWTGWTVRQVHPNDLDDPLAAGFTGTVYVAAESTGWVYRVGTSEPPADWAAVDFVTDGSWVPGQAGFGFGDGDDHTEPPGLAGSNTTLYIRHPFVIADTATVSALQLSLWVDDGCIAYVNGQDVARVAVDPGAVKAYDDIADALHEANRWETFHLGEPAGLLVPGTNVLAVHALNRSKTSNDFSIDAELRLPGVWSLAFEPADHETTNKVLFAEGTVDARFGAPFAGLSYELALPERFGASGIDDGYDVLEHLADLPYTMEYVCVKLCQLLVHDRFTIGSYYNVGQLSPEAELVKACMIAWDTPGPDGRKGNLRNVLQAIVDSDLFRSQAAIRQKVKTPFEYVVSALRALRVDTGGSWTAETDGYDLAAPMDYMGMKLFGNPSPDGWPEAGEEWIDTSTVSERLRFLQNLLMRTDNPDKQIDYRSSGDDNLCDPVALLQDRLDAGSWSDDAAVVGFFLALLYPGEGLANLDLDVDECLLLLNADAAGTPDASLFSALTPGSVVYDERVRSLAGLLLANPKFHEQ